MHDADNQRYAVALQVLWPEALLPAPVMPGVSLPSWQLPKAVLSWREPPPVFPLTWILPWTAIPWPFPAGPIVTCPAHGHARPGLAWPVR